MRIYEREFIQNYVGQADMGDVGIQLSCPLGIGGQKIGAIWEWQ